MIGPQEKIIIHCDIKLCVKAIQLFNQIPSAKNPLMIDSLLKIEPKVKPARFTGTLLRPILNVAGHDVRSFVHLFNNCLDRIVMHEIIVSVKKNDIFSLGKGSAFIHCIGDTLIFFRNYMIYRILIFLNNAQRAICRSAIDNDIFDIFICLV